MIEWLFCPIDPDSFWIGLLIGWMLMSLTAINIYAIAQIIKDEIGNGGGV